MSDIEDRRFEEKERRRGEILDAAEKVFEVVGFEQATMEQVARKARLSRALVYVYFKDKSDLHLAIAGRAHLALGDRFAEAVLRHKKGLDQIEAIGRAYLAFSQEFPVYFEALASFEAQEADTTEGNVNLEACFESSDRIFRIMGEAFAAGISDGSIRHDAGDPMLNCTTLWAFMHGVIQLTATKAEILAHDGVNAQALTRHALAFARRSLAGPKA
jgi:AcrR family transcriptional regulator